MKELVIGIDFGTHSTKVVFRDELDSKVGVVLAGWPVPDQSNAGHPLDGPYPWFGLPSVMGVQGDYLLFGESARLLPLSDRLYSIKMLLADDNLPLGPLAPLLHQYRHRDATMLIVATHLTWVFDQVRRQLDLWYGVGGWCPFMIVLPAPMTQHEDPRLRERYERVVHAALHGATKLAEYPTWERLHAATAFKELLPVLHALPPQESERNYDIRAETVAGMVPLSNDPERAPGLYNLVDVGGGTIELSLVFKRQVFRRLIDCDIDDSVLRTHTRAEAQMVARRLASMWNKAYHRALKVSWHAGQEWIRTNRVLCFGGGVSEALKHELWKEHPLRHLPRRGELEFVDYSASSAILDWKRACAHAANSNVKPRTEDRRLLTVALGLAYYPNFWPDWYGPGGPRSGPMASEHEYPTDYTLGFGR